MVDSISNGSWNEEVTDQFSVWITRSQGTHTNTIAPRSSPCRWTRAKTSAANTSKQRRYPCFGPPADSTNYRKWVSNFLSSWLANRQWLFQKANHGAYSNPGTQVEAQGCFTERLNQSWVSSVAQANHRINIYYASIDKVLSEFELRFSGNDQ